MANVLLNANENLHVGIISLSRLSPPDVNYEFIIINFLPLTDRENIQISIYLGTTHWYGGMHGSAHTMHVTYQDSVVQAYELLSLGSLPTFNI